MYFRIRAHIQEIKMKIAAICLCWILILTAPGVMAQQPASPHQSWDILRQLRAGEKIEVERKTGKKNISGKMASLADLELAIERRGKNESISRDEVKNIWLVAPTSRKKRVIFAAVGGGVGLFAGGLIGLGLAFKQCQPNCGDEKAGAVAAVVGLSVGGALLGQAMVRNGKRTLIYSAP
jgi:hypothetical protein